MSSAGGSSTRDPDSLVGGDIDVNAIPNDVNVNVVGDGSVSGGNQEGSNWLFDMALDPLETVNHYLDTSATYSTIKAEIYKRAMKLIDERVSIEDPDGTNQKSTWKRAGGVVPWIDEQSEDRTIFQLYNNSAAPNIVFVLVDDWGYNDIGYRSSYLNWTTPNIDRLASEGIKLESYYTHQLCTPSRAAFLTGRYSFRLGMGGQQEGSGELPLGEVTIAEELKSAGYRTYMVGKWHVGYSSFARTPMRRGFDKFYGFYNGFVDYWTKYYGNYLDLQNGSELETDPTALESKLHNGILLQQKAELILQQHAQEYGDGTPFFLYYAMQLIHEDWEAPDWYKDRCAEATATDQQVTYCAMNVMVDEAISNLTCTLNQLGFADNTVLIVSSDNGGVNTMEGNNLPWRGCKGSSYRGGVSNTAFIHSPLLPESLRGSVYNHTVHITDWLPTVMFLATGGAWQAGLAQQFFDGYNIWPHLLDNTPTERKEIIHDLESENVFAVESIAYQMKLIYGQLVNLVTEPHHIFETDRSPDQVRLSCSIDSISLLDSQQAETQSTSSSAVVDYILSSSHLDTSFGLSVWVSLLCVVTFLFVYIAVSKVPRFQKRSGYESIDDSIKRNLNPVDVYEDERLGASKSYQRHDDNNIII